MPLDPSNPNFMVKAWKAAKKVETNGEYLMIPLKVINVQSDLGKYILEVIYGESTCRKSEPITPAMMATHCQKKHGGSRALYSVTVSTKLCSKRAQYIVEKIRNIAVEK
ncbi:hypothetical protein Y032_0993g3331 [Ancylostoma ceylanicum]|nr:hypothetical protein Y032_0993g3331 [Ancylostoma ceylanicum]